jgi:hypothetical protein
MSRHPGLRLISAVSIASLLVVAGCGKDDNGGALDTGSGTAPLRDGATTVPPGATVLTADLAGADEVPGPGAKEGTGTVRLVLTPDGKVCADLATSKVEAATAAHVHSGARGVAGPIVITLPTPKDGRASGCTTADPAAVAKVVAHPEAAYANVHTAALPNGAIRGQLAKP